MTLTDKADALAAKAPACCGEKMGLRTDLTTWAWYYLCRLCGKRRKAR